MPYRNRSVAVGLLILAACNPGPERAPSNADATAPATEAIACAVGGSQGFSSRCGVERIDAQGTLFLTVHHPDGAFRRFEVLRDGRGLAVADGADEAVSRLDGEVLEVAVGADRYRFPATRASNVARP